MQRQESELAKNDRLNNYERDGILRNAIEGSFADRKKSLAERSDALVREILVTKFGEKTMKVVYALPEAWIPSRCHLYPTVSGWHYTLHALKSTRIPCETTHALDKWPELCAKVEAFVSDNEAYEQDRQKARNVLDALLDSCKTYKQLADIWPDGHEYYKNRVAPPPPPQALIKIDDLNKLLGLPKETAPANEPEAAVADAA